MNGKKVTLGLILFVLGFLGIAATLTMDIPLPPEAEAMLKSQFTDQQIKLLTLVNPSILLLIAVVIGMLLYRKTSLRIPIFENWLGIEKEPADYTGILKFGVLGGIAAGVLLSLVGFAFIPTLPEEFRTLSESIQPTLLARFLYGGITEEVLMRFGLMTFLVWVGTKLIKGDKAAIYWVGIILAALLFAVGHFPVAYQAVGTPSVGLLTYILIGNTVGGIIFGWLYWRKGLESAFVAHIFSHVVMISFEPLLT